MENFENELRKKNQKNKEYKLAVSKHEKAAQDKTNELQIMNNQLMELSRSREEFKAKEASLQGQVKDAELRLQECQKQLEVSQTTINYLNQKLADASRPFLKLNTTKEHGWVGSAPSALSSTAQNILSKNMELLQNPFGTSIGSGKDKGEKNYYDQIKDKDTNQDALEFLRTETKRTIESARKDRREADEENPRVPLVTKTIQPVRFKSD